MHKEVMHKEVMLYLGYFGHGPLALCDGGYYHEHMLYHWENVTCKECLKERGKKKKGRGYAKIHNKMEY